MSNQTEQELVEEAVAKLSKFVNNMCHNPMLFVDAIMIEHRTLQQSIFNVFMQCIKAWAETKNFDARNEYTVTLCKKIMAAVKDDYFGRTPLI